MIVLYLVAALFVLYFVCGIATFLVGCIPGFK
jgi:hypothetical protein